MEKDAKIYVSGHRGLVGSAIVRKLRRKGLCQYHNPQFSGIGFNQSGGDISIF